MYRLWLILLFLGILLLAACESAPSDPQSLPTLIVLPTETAPPVPDITLTPPPLLPPSTEPPAVATEAPSGERAEVRAATGTATITATVTLTETMTPTQTETGTVRPSLTPSMTITDTPTRTVTITPYTEEDLSPLFQLAVLALSSTPPPTGLYVLPTATLPSAVTADPGVGSTLCLPPQGGFGAVYIADPAFSTQIGCSLGVPHSYPAAVQTFERGLMIYVGTSPASIYTLYAMGTFTRHDDTWIEGVDPTGGDASAPAGLYEPVRGFGKVWRTDPAVSRGLGWATQPETGTTATLLMFQSGQMIALPPLGQIAVLATNGSYRLIAGTP